MSTELKQYLLSGARDVPQIRAAPFESNNLALALRRHAHAYAQSRPNARNRLSLDLETCYPSYGEGTGALSFLDGSHSQLSSRKSTGIPGVKYRGAVSDLSAVTNRRSLDIGALMNCAATASVSGPTTPRRRTVTFHPNTSGPNGGVQYVTQYHFEDENDEGNNDLNQDYLVERASRSRRRRRADLIRDDSLDVAQENEDHTGVSPQLAKLVVIVPKSYAEAQRLKKMLKRAVSGPNATFEDLKLYRNTMKNLRKIVKQEQEREIELANEEARENQLQHELEQVRYTVLSCNPIFFAEVILSATISQSDFLLFAFVTVSLSFKNVTRNKTFT